jgi:hypothetical protein
MADAVQESRAVGGIATNDGPGAIVDLGAGHIDTKDPAELRTYQAGGWPFSDLAALVRILERVYAEQLDADPLRRSYVEQTVTLTPYENLSVLDARPYGYSRVAIYSPVTVNALLRTGTADIALTLTAGKFAAIQQPQGTRILLAAPGQNVVIFRYSDQLYGTITP